MARQGLLRHWSLSRDGDGRSTRLSDNLVFPVALKPKRKVILKDPLTGLLSGRPGPRGWMSSED